MELIDDTFGNLEQLKSHLVAYAKRYAPLSVHRRAFSLNKFN